MFDGGSDLTTASPAARQVRYVNRGGPHPVKIIYTGALPPAQQVAEQVRSGSGMTFGVRSHDGAKMPSVPKRLA